MCPNENIKIYLTEEKKRGDNTEKAKANCVYPHMG